MSLYFIFYQKLKERTQDVYAWVHFKVWSKTVCLESHTRTSRIRPQHKTTQSRWLTSRYQPLQEEKASLLKNSLKQIPKIWLLFKSHKSHLFQFFLDWWTALLTIQTLSLWAQTAVSGETRLIHCTNCFQSFHSPQNLSPKTRFTHNYKHSALSLRFYSFSLNYQALKHSSYMNRKNILNNLELKTEVEGSQKLYGSNYGNCYNVYLFCFSVCLISVFTETMHMKQNVSQSSTCSLPNNMNWGQMFFHKCVQKGRQYSKINMRWFSHLQIMIRFNIFLSHRAVQAPALHLKWLHDQNVALEHWKNKNFNRK